MHPTFLKLTLNLRNSCAGLGRAKTDPKEAVQEREEQMLVKQSAEQSAERKATEKVRRLIITAANAIRIVETAFCRTASSAQQILQQKFTVDYCLMTAGIPWHSWSLAFLFRTPNGSFLAQMSCLEMDYLDSSVYCASMLSFWQQL